MSKSIVFALNPSAWTKKHLDEDKLGGTQRCLSQIAHELSSRGWDVVITPSGQQRAGTRADVVIHDNVVRDEARNLGAVSVLVAGSWHATVLDEHLDAVVCPSEFAHASFIVQRRKQFEADIIPFCGGDDIRPALYEPKQGVIFCHSNPNRHLQHSEQIGQIIDSLRIPYQWRVCGGNRLYSETFTEQVRLSVNGPAGMRHLGILNRRQVIDELSQTHLWVYPYFSNDAETFCIAAVEAAAMGVPVLVPEHALFREVLPEAVFLTPDKAVFASEIKMRLAAKDRIKYPSVENYRVSAVTDQYEELFDKLKSTVQITSGWESIKSCTVSDKLTEEMHALKRWASEADGSTAIEVGSYHGASTALLAEHFDHVLAIDLWGNVDDGLKYYDEIGQHHFVSFIKNMISHRLIGRVHPVVSTSEFLDMLPPLSVSFAFIDGDHHYEAVKKDAERVGRHVAIGGLLCFHDYKRPGYGYPPFDPNHPHHGPRDPWSGVARTVDELLQLPQWELHEHVCGIIALRRIT